MNENVENIMLEHLRAIRGDIAAIRDDISTVKAEQMIIRQHVAGLVGTEVLNGQRFALFETRLDRIERRLELVD